MQKRRVSTILCCLYHRHGLHLKVSFPQNMSDNKLTVNAKRSEITEEIRVACTTHLPYSQISDASIVFNTHLHTHTIPGCTDDKQVSLFCLIKLTNTTFKKIYIFIYPHLSVLPSNKNIYLNTQH